jgi:hypothetical protein
VRYSPYRAPKMPPIDDAYRLLQKENRQLRHQIKECEEDYKHQVLVTQLCEEEISHQKDVVAFYRALWDGRYSPKLFKEGALPSPNRITAVDTFVAATGALIIEGNRPGVRLITPSRTVSGCQFSPSIAGLITFIGTCFTSWATGPGINRGLAATTSLLTGGNSEQNRAKICGRS